MPQIKKKFFNRLFCNGLELRSAKLEDEVVVPRKR